LKLRGSEFNVLLQQLVEDVPRAIREFTEEGFALRAYRIRALPSSADRGAIGDVAEEVNVKYQENKIFEIADADGFGIALAGAGDFAAISACVDLLRDASPPQSSQSMPALKERCERLLSGRRLRGVKRNATARA